MSSVPILSTTASAASTPFIPRRTLRYEALFVHLVHLIQTVHPTAASVPAPSGQPLPAFVLDSLGDIVLALNHALRTFYPLQDAHKRAIFTYMHQVFAWMDAASNAYSLDLDSSESNSASPASRPVTPSQPQAQGTSVSMLSPNRREALKLTSSAKCVEPVRWMDLCFTVDAARQIHTRMQQVTGPDITAGFLTKLHARIDEFLSDLRMMRPNFQSLFSNLSTASLEPQEARDQIMEALDKIASDDTCTSDEAVTYLILSLPAHNSRPDGSRDNRELEHHFAQQLRREYRGDAPARFLRFVHSVNRHFTKCANADQFFDSYLQATSIVQSSGTGKTRLVLELGKKAPLLYVCVRRKLLDVPSSVKQGFPLAEQDLYEFFHSATRIHKASPDLQVAVFLAAWFETLCLRLEARATPQQKYEYLAQLNDYGGPGITQRQPFFQAVITSAHTKLSSATVSAFASTATSGASAAKADVFAQHLDTAVCNLGAQLELVREWLWHQHEAYYKALGIDCPPIFVAFDECVELIVPDDSTKSSTKTSSNTTAPKRDPDNHQLNSLRRAWHHLLKLQRNKSTGTFWLILLSTNTGAAELIRSQHMQASTRAQEKPVLPIFVGLGFDVLRAEQPQLISPSDVSALHHLRSYGRPLWSSLPTDTFWEVAKLKLLGAKAFSSTEPVVCYNLLASRLSLQFIPIHRGDSALFGEQKSLVTQSVDRHMRMLQQVIDHTSLVISAPSEPVLAIAATLIMLAGASEPSDQTLSPPPPPNYAKVIQTFTTQCLPTLGSDFLRGAHGEFMARFAMMAAWDAFKLGLLQSEHRHRHGRQGDRSDPASLVSEAVPLQAFLEQLATLDAQSASVISHAIDDVCDTVRKRLARHTPRPSSCGAPAINKHGDDDEEVNAWVNFTHFDALPGGINCISPDYLWYCWKRGVALQMAHGQAGVDGIIPVFVGKLSQRFRAPVGSNSSVDAGVDADDEIDEAQAARQMSYVAWEAKYRDEAMGDAEARKPSRAGPPLLPAACDGGADAETEGEAGSSRPELAPLTRAGLVTVLADLGTKQAFASDRSCAPRAKIVSTIGGESTFVRLWVRGMEDVRAYPCFDVLGVREKMMALFQTIPVSPGYEVENKNASPVWRPGTQPEIRSRVHEGPLQSWHWSSPILPAVADADEDNIDPGEPMEL
ncbi:uncharacterized protein UTRI_04414_B [Ustilago trichophora]|uniref:Uncharacterized protein n=1 Tax=Ustilago trichophora TaxID=86804 RepID=A0A5C3EM45_9BASI|nr:uncharacterized protein UTRI_04414_B [Ustilago trichophora]